MSRRVIETVPVTADGDELGEVVRTELDGDESWQAMCADCVWLSTFWTSEVLAGLALLTHHDERHP